MPQTLSITGKRASATVFCSNLILVERTIAFLNAYGPTQEFSQAYGEYQNMNPGKEPAHDGS